MSGPVIYTTMDFDQPWTLENYLKVGGYQALRKVLTENLAKLRALADVLLEREVLDGDEIDTVLAGRKLEDLPPPAPPVVGVVDAEKNPEKKRRKLFGLGGLSKLPDPEPGKA